MARKNRHDIKNDKGFGERLKEAFGGKSNTEIARDLGVSDSAVTLYIKGRIPSAPTLVAISKLTLCNLHWLLTGVGEKKISISKSETRTLVFQGGKGGVGTTTAAMLTAVVLATRGHRTLLVSNQDNIVPFLLFLNKNRDSGFPSSETMPAKSDKYTSTFIQNLEIFTNKGDKFVFYFEDQAESVEKSKLQIKKEYKFIIFDIRKFGYLFDKGEIKLKSFLSEGNLIIPYEVGNSSPETITSILGSINLGSVLFSSSFLGLFINKEVEKYSVLRFYQVKKEIIKNAISDKMFKTVIKNNSETLADFILNTDLEKLKKTQLFKNFSSLVDEILERLKK